MSVAGLAAGLWLGSRWPSYGLEISQTNAADSRCAVVLSGEITAGDADRMIRFIDENFVQKRRSLSAIYLDSGGGGVVEGGRIARIVHRLGVTVVVGDTAACRSSCVLILASAVRRVIGLHARLAVHSTSADYSLTGGIPAEDDSAVAETLKLARLYHWYGVPDSLVVKMVTTLPSEAYTLTESDKELLRTSVSP